MAVRAARKLQQALSYPGDRASGAYPGPGRGSHVVYSWHSLPFTWPALPGDKTGGCGGGGVGKQHPLCAYPPVPGGVRWVGHWRFTCRWGYLKSGRVGRELVRCVYVCGCVCLRE